MLWWIYGSRSRSGEQTHCFLISTAYYSIMSQLQDEERDFSCWVAPSSIFPPPLHSWCTLWCSGLHSASVFTCFCTSFLKWIHLACRDEWVFSWSNPVPETWVLISALLNILQVGIGAVFISSLFKPCSFLKIKVNVAGFPASLIAFYLFCVGSLLSLGTWFFCLTPFPRSIGV